MSEENLGTTLSAVLQDLFVEMLGMPLTEHPPEHSPPAELLSDGAVVHILGDWMGSVVFQCGPSTARSIAQRMFGLQRVSTEEIDDALREIANIIGGNLKGVLGERCVLSTPKTKRQIESPTGIQEGLLAHSSYCLSGTEPLLVNVYRSELEL